MILNNFIPLERGFFVNSTTIYGSVNNMFILCRNVLTITCETLSVVKNGIAVCVRTFALSVILFLLCANILFAQETTATEEEIAAHSIGAEFEINNNYIWHGMILNEQPVAHPYLWWEYDEWSCNVYSNFVLGNEANKHRFNEVDVAFGRSITLNDFTIEPSVQYYAYFGQEDSPNTAMLVTLCTYAVNDAMSVFYDAEYDMLAYKGALYSEAGININYGSEEVNVENIIGIGAANSVFNEEYVGVSRNAISFVHLDCAITLSVGNNLSLRPHIEVNKIIDASLRNVSARPDNISLGLVLIYEF